MPTISTGNPGWDQNLSTLGNALFPDPSKVGQGYYYGAEARKQQLESNKITDQQNWKNRFMMGQPGFGLPQAAAPTWNQPPLEGAAPIVAPPSNLPMTGQAQQPPLSSAIVGPSGGQIVPQTMPVNQAVAIGAERIENAPTNRGTPPPVSPPAPGAAPAPNTTASDGSVPANDPTAAGFHPATLQPPGGGIKYASPAAANGSPAPPVMDLGTFVSMAVASGMDAAQAQAVGAASIGAAVQQGRITPKQAHDLLGSVGQPQLGVADITAAGNLATTNVHESAETARNAARIGGENYRFEQTPKVIINEQGVPTFLPQSQVAGKPAYEPSVATTIAGHDQTYVLTDQGPGNPPKTMTAKEARETGATIYQPTLANTIAGQTSKIDTYINPNNPLEEKTMSAGDAARTGWVEKPKNEGEQRAIIEKAIVRETDPTKLDALRDKLSMIGTPAKPPDAEEVQKQGFQADTALEKLFPVPSNAPFSNTMPAGASPELGPILTDLTNQYLTQSTDRAVRGNPVQAANKALEQLLRQKFINPEQVRHRFGSAILKPAYDKAGNPIEPQERFRVDLIDPSSPDKKPFAPGKAPSRIPMERPLSSAIVPPPAAPAASGPTPNLVPSAPPPVLRGGAGAMPPGALAAAPGQPDGKTGTVGGTPTIVRGGFAYPR